MLGKNPSISSGGVKKKAPPRPPPPTATTGGGMKTSQSFRTAGDLQSQRIQSFGTWGNSYSVDHHTSNRSRNGGGDLIDFATPPGSPQGSRKGSTTASLSQKGPPDFYYRVGASIFYVKSELRNTLSSVPSQAANPFSPPRPSAQAMLASPAKQLNYRTSNTLYSNVPSMSQSATTTNGSSVKYNPTIIRRPNNNNDISNNNITKPSNYGSESVRSSSGSSDWSDYSVQSGMSQQLQPRYGNIPVGWDEPPAQYREEPASVPAAPPTAAPISKTVVVPTIIKPPTPQKPSLLPKPKLAGLSKSPVPPTKPEEPRNYYDEPPEDVGHDDSYISPPMPNEPPPPPPPEVEEGINDWVDSTKDAPSAYEGQEETSPYANQPYHQASNTDSNRAYAIALYDYLSDVEGDLPLQAGDLVYLMKQIDEQWFYGHCAGVEGLFPANHVNIVVPLPDEPEEPPQQQRVPAFDPSKCEKIWFADALYTFDAEAEGDLSLRPGDMVKIFGRLNDDWLYGEVAGKVGQFPASFVEPVPSDLPAIPTS